MDDYLYWLAVSSSIAAAVWLFSLAGKKRKAIFPILLLIACAGMAAVYGRSSDRLPDLSKGEVAPIHVIYQSPETNERIFVLRLKDGKEGRETSEDLKFKALASMIKEGDRLTRTEDGLEVLQHSASPKN